MSLTVRGSMVAWGADEDVARTSISNVPKERGAVKFPWNSPFEFVRTPAISGMAVPLMKNSNEAFPIGDLSEPRY